MPSPAPRASLHLAALLCCAMACAAAMPGARGQPPSIEPGVLQGRVVDARGAPLAGAQVSAHHTLLENRTLTATSDTDGRYRLDVSRPAGAWTAAAHLSRDHRGTTYVIDLAPDAPAPFAGSDGALRDFTWRLQGERDDDLGHHGMPVIYELAIFADPQHPGEFLDAEHVELTLVPDGPLLDGSTGGTITRFGKRTADGPALVDIPLGVYTITGRYVAPQHGARPLLLRVRDSGEFVPALTTGFTELLRTRYHILLDVTLDAD